MANTRPEFETPAVPARYVTCPGCGGESLYELRNAFRPFCSERCKNIDLGAWSSEAFRVAAPPTSEDADLLDD